MAFYQRNSREGNSDLNILLLEEMKKIQEQNLQMTMVIKRVKAGSVVAFLLLEVIDKASIAFYITIDFADGLRHIEARMEELESGKYSLNQATL